MMFDLPSACRTLIGRAALAAALLPVVWTVAAYASEFGTAVVPTQIIYPGQEIDGDLLQTVEVTNPNLAQGYAQNISEVQGLVSTRTLLPGRTIMLNSLRQQYTVKRGDKVVLVYDNGTLRITAAGTPLEDASTGALIKVRNTDSGLIVSGTVSADGSIMVVQK